VFYFHFYPQAYVTSPPLNKDSSDVPVAPADIGNASDLGIVVSIVDETSLSAQSLGLAVYFLAIFGLVPLVLAVVFAAKFFLNRRSNKVGSKDKILLHSSLVFQKIKSNFSFLVLE